MRIGKEKRPKLGVLKQVFSPVGIGVSNPFSVGLKSCEKITEDNKEIDAKKCI